MVFGIRVALASLSARTPAPPSPNAFGKGLTRVRNGAKLRQMVERLMDPKSDPEENGEELSLRPKRLREYIGQDQLKDNLKIAIEAATRRQEPLDHLLLYG